MNSVLAGGFGVLVGMQFGVQNQWILAGLAGVVFLLCLVVQHRIQARAWRWFEQRVKARFPSQVPPARERK